VRRWPHPCSGPPLARGTGYPGHPPRDFFGMLTVPAGLGGPWAKEGGGKMGDELFLVTIHADLRIRRLLWRPITVMGLDEGGDIIDVELIEKAAILCDSCGRRVAADSRDLEEGLPTGYALCDKECIVEVVCEGCRRRYFPALRVYDSLDDLGGGGG